MPPNGSQLRTTISPHAEYKLSLLPYVDFKRNESREHRFTATYDSEQMIVSLDRPILLLARRK